MKYFQFLSFVFAFVLCSCVSNNEPPLETALPIAQNYLPATLSFSADDNEWTDKIKDWSDKQIRVDSPEELPDDPLGFSDAYSGINFNRYTLLLSYNIHNWTIDTYHNRYYRDNIEGIYNWNICVSTATSIDDSSTQLYFTRYAVLVNKIPAEREVKIWFSLGALNWSWE